MLVPPSPGRIAKRVSQDETGPRRAAGSRPLSPPAPDVHPRFGLRQRNVVKETSPPGGSHSLRGSQTIRGDIPMAHAVEAHDAKQFINGEWTGAADGTTFQKKNPYNGQVASEVP